MTKCISGLMYKQSRLIKIRIALPSYSPLLLGRGGRRGGFQQMARLPTKGNHGEEGLRLVGGLEST
jgi:hypothetical protein